MKTSNKLLSGLLIVVLLSITAVLGTARYYAVDKPAKPAPQQEVPSPPATPEPPKATEE